MHIADVIFYYEYITAIPINYTVTAKLDASIYSGVSESGCKFAALVSRNLRMDLTLICIIIILST